MKILYLSLRFPYPPHRGDKIRTCNFLKHLSQRHSISFISFAHSPLETSYMGQLKEYCDQVETVKFSSLRAYANCLLCFSFREPFQVVYWHSREMQRRVDRMMDRDGFDIIQVQFLRMAQYVTKYTDTHKVLDSCDSYSLNLNRRSRLDRGLSWPLLKVEASRIMTYEIGIARRFDRVTMVSPLDRDYMLLGSPSQAFGKGLSERGNAGASAPAARNGSIPISIVPMGVDLDYFQPGHKECEPILLFTGIMSYFPNADAVQYFCSEIFPLIKDAVPNAKFYIVGNSPTRKVVKLMGSGDVVVTGRVEDVRPYFDRSAVFVCPLRSGSGMQTKILEAMAMGVPVVTTSMGFEALEATAGRDIIVADNPKKFAQEVVCLLKDGELRQSVTQNARRLVEGKYGWSSVVGRLDAIYQDITTTCPAE